VSLSRKGALVPYEPPDWLVRAVSTFGRSAREQLSTGAGEPEEALRTPLVALVKEIGSRHGLRVVPVGEAMLSDLQVRPDYAVQVDGAICGYIEIKKPGLGADASALTGSHNCRQWARLSNLPNLIYTDGRCWARYETGVRKGEIIKLDGTLTGGSGDLRVTGPEFEQMLVTFLGWAPRRSATSMRWSGRSPRPAGCSAMRSPTSSLASGRRSRPGRT
jgi:hypothetical protein